MSNASGHNRHDESHVGQGVLASSGGVVKMRDLHFYGMHCRHAPLSDYEQSNANVRVQVNNLVPTNGSRF
jgi:hypothetical protein